MKPATGGRRKSSAGSRRSKRPSLATSDAASTKAEEIDPDQFLTLEGEEKDEFLRRLFRKYDLDGNEVMDTEELHVILGALGFEGTPAAVARLFRDIDLDADGLIDIEEFVQFFERLEDLAQLKQAILVGQKKSGMWVIIAGFYGAAVLAVFFAFALLFINNPQQGGVAFWGLVATGAMTFAMLCWLCVVPIIQLRLGIGTDTENYIREKESGDVSMFRAPHTPDIFVNDDTVVDVAPMPPTEPLETKPALPGALASVTDWAMPRPEQLVSTYRTKSKQLEEDRRTPSRPAMVLDVLAVEDVVEAYHHDRYEMARELARNSNTVQFNPVSASRCQSDTETMREFHRGNLMSNRSGKTSPAAFDSPTNRPDFSQTAPAAALRGVSALHNSPQHSPKQRSMPPRQLQLGNV
mmetsp:Transcript_129304/g.295011  ORF Transcript_129304/g.295011 Transcript_129304/m.295011 type:complete len:409 (-) Transcript_129304:120-1346(-)